jgi:hypothetical protein
MNVVGSRQDKKAFPGMGVFAGIVAISKATVTGVPGVTCTVPGVCMARL